jgi:hypothetical protein
VGVANLFYRGDGNFSRPKLPFLPRNLAQSLLTWRPCQAFEAPGGVIASTMSTSLQNAFRLGAMVAALGSGLLARGGMEDDFATALTGQTGRAVDAAGVQADPKSGRPANAPECVVRITGTTGHTKSDAVELEVAYEASYRPAGAEKPRRLVGKASLLVTLRACQPTALKWERLSEPADAPGEARILIQRALQNAVAPVL